VFSQKLDNFKNKPAGVLKKFYDQMPTLPASDDITRFDGTYLVKKGGKHRTFSLKHQNWA
jgi:hypothetical protein